MNQVTTREILGRTVYCLEIPERMTQAAQKLTGRVRMALHAELDDRDYDDNADNDEVRADRPSQEFDGQNYPFPVVYRHTFREGSGWHVSCLSSADGDVCEFEGKDIEDIVAWLIKNEPAPTS